METTPTMTNLPEHSWGVSLAYLSYRDHKTVTSGASGSPLSVHNVAKVPWTHWRVFSPLQRESNLMKKRQSLRPSFLTEPVADSSERHTNNMADGEYARARSRVCLRG